MTRSRGAAEKGPELVGSAESDAPERTRAILVERLVGARLAAAEVARLPAPEEAAPRVRPSSSGIDVVYLDPRLLESMETLIGEQGAVA